MATPTRAPRRTTTMPRRKRRADPWRVASYVVIALFLVWVLVPILTVAINSLKPPSAIFTSKPRLTFHATLKNYHNVLGNLDFLKYLVNSSIVAVGSTLLSLLVGVPAAYALARLPVPGREWWARGVLFTRMVPAVALIVPMFVVFDKLSLLGTYWARSQPTRPSAFRS